MIKISIAKRKFPQFFFSYLVPMNDYLVSLPKLNLF